MFDVFPTWSRNRQKQDSTYKVYTGLKTAFSDIAGLSMKTQKHSLFSSKLNNENYPAPYWK